MNALGVKNDQHLETLLSDRNYIAQEKLDGMRAIVHVTRNGLRIFGRSAGVNDPTHPLEKTSALPHLAKLKFPGLIGTIIDCEILARNMDSAQLSGSIHQKNGHNALVKLFVFDVLSFCGKDLMNQKLAIRLKWLESLEARMASGLIHFLPWTQIPEAKRNLHRSILDNGGEGIMLKNLNETYVEGARPSNNWFKAKKSSTFDCVVMGFTKGKGKFNAQIGAVVFGQYVDGQLKELGQASGMTESVRLDMSDHPDRYIGKVVTIKGMERLKSGAIRHPQFLYMRYDKSPNQCRWYPNEQ